MPTVELSPPCIPNVNMDDCCGDGVLDEFEECDAGNYNSDAGECTSKCKEAFCGDGLVLPYVEACDGDPLCTSECTFTTCGNGAVEPYEWCEPRGPADPECTDLCGDGRKVIFVTSVHYKGGEIGSILGGLAGADARCQELAVNAGVPGDFKAWLATSEDDAPLVRFNWLEGPYVDVNGNLIAETWSEIVYNPPPNVTEWGNGTTPSEITWPWVFPMPTNLVAWASPINDVSYSDPELPFHCGEWNDVTKQGSIALLDHNPDIPNNASQQFKAGGAEPCSKAAPIVCVEQ